MVGAVVHTADVQDRDGAPLVLRSIRHAWSWLRHVFADGDWRIEIIKRSDAASGFEVLPGRWVIERTFAWLGRSRRLAKDWEASTASSEAWLLSPISAYLSGGWPAFTPRLSNYESGS